MKHTLLFLLFPFLIFSQTQIGQTFFGEEAYDYLGKDVSISSNGNIVAITSMYSSEYGESSGFVAVYENISGVWTQIGQDISNGISYEGFGVSTSLSANGNILAIGAYANDANGPASGQVRVYENINDVWTQIGQDLNGSTSLDQLGLSVSISSDGTIVAMGAPSYTYNDNLSGYVRVYEYVGEVWMQIGADIEGEFISDVFGDSIDLSSDGNTLIIGALGHDINGNQSGQVKVYENLEGIWTQIGQDLNGDEAEDFFGWTVSISSNSEIIAIGASGNNNDFLGQVKVYENILGVWTQIGNNILGDIPGENLGTSVSLSSDGSILAIGCINNEDNLWNSGQVKIFKYILNSWTQIGNSINGENENDYFGSNISLSGDSHTIIIGSHSNSENGINSGQVKVYDLSEVLSSDEFVLSKFSLYPNPANNQVNIQLQEGLEFKQANIYNTLGQFISTSKEKVINTTHLSPGMYLVEIETSQGKATKQLVIE
ncbi:T9SS type A sorting domain-containing protein [Bizionia arctica]|uniref:Secretion system C-terminal sorting domain-containing protein n=1 Tax=Bizionia arctica TaxID=1495645 RepID=A0A917GCK0_9FLAO|nr:T9SS type A sorting domain-containing protein [Bizionia arctica]GGG36967.1 hypothetical protein GCM10010976_05770 [Bizionia arctica]